MDMAILAKMLEAIKDASQSPLSLVAFLAVAITILILGVRSHRLSGIRDSLKDLPEKDRRRILEVELGQPLPPGMNPDQWLRFQRQKYVFIGFISLLFFAAALYAISIFSHKDPPPPEIAVEEKAREELTYFYGAKDNEQFNLWLDTIKQQEGSLAQFKSTSAKYRAQLIETPVQRTKVGGDATQVQGVALFDAETDSGMVWREQVALVKVGSDWKVSGLTIYPRDWFTITTRIPTAPASLSAFIEGAKNGEGTMGWIPLPGWNVRTVGAPVPVDNTKRICDLVVAFGSHKATMRGVYGACGLKDGSDLSILGVASINGEDVTLSKIRFVPL